MHADIVIAGGGPAGLASAIAAAMRGLNPLVLERQFEPVDKACGEGLLPPAVEALDRLGVRHLIDSAQCFPFAGITLHNEDGSRASGTLPRGGGLGVPRLVLISALMARAQQLGVKVRERCAVVGFTPGRDSIAVETTGGVINTNLLVAADGLRSRLRRIAGLEVSAGEPRRFGIRQHFRVEPWSSCVEVHFGRGVEAYVTPLGAELIGITFLWEEETFCGARGLSDFIGLFPALASRLRGAEACSKVRGAGPMLQRSRSWVAPRFVMVGDAGGYIDAITGEGLSLAFSEALALGRVIPDAIFGGSPQSALACYQRQASRDFRHFALVTRLMVNLARRPRLRRCVVRGLGRSTRTFDLVLSWSLGKAPEALSVRKPAGDAINQHGRSAQSARATSTFSL